MWTDGFFTCTMSLSAYLPRDDRRTVSPSSSSMAVIENVMENKNWFDNWVVWEIRGKITVFYQGEGNDYREVQKSDSSRNWHLPAIPEQEGCSLSFLSRSKRVGRWEALGMKLDTSVEEILLSFMAQSDHSHVRSCARTYRNFIGLFHRILTDIAIANIIRSFRKNPEMDLPGVLLISLTNITWLQWGHTRSFHQTN